MSRINRKKHITISDGTEKQVVYNKGVSRKVSKKIGHKGDYAIVDFTSPFISSVKTGGGTDDNPYIYTIDLEDNIVNSIAANKDKLLEQMNDSKKINGSVNAIEQKRVDLLKGFDHVFSFNIDLSTFKLIDIANSKDMKIAVRKSIDSKKGNRNHYNNEFYVGGNFTLPFRYSIKSNLRIKSKDNGGVANQIQCELGYKVNVTKGRDNSSFIFSLLHNNMPISYSYLEEKINTNMSEASIDFLIEYK